MAKNQLSQQQLKMSKLTKVCLSLAGMVSTSQSFAVDAKDVSAEIQKMVLESIACPNSAEQLSVLAREIKFQSESHSQEANLFSTNFSVVEQWCRKQLVPPTARDMKYCLTKFSPQLDQYLKLALSGNDSRKELSVFSSRDKVVAPDCKLSRSEQRRIVSAYGIQRSTASSSPKVDAVVSAHSAPASEPAPQVLKAQPLVDKAPLIRRAYPVADGITQIPAEKKDTEDQAQQLHKEKRNAGPIEKIVTKISHAFKGKQCPAAEKISKALADGTLLKERPCKNAFAYNDYMLEEIIAIHRDLDKLKKNNPSKLSGAGGGYKLAGYGVNMPLKMEGHYNYSGDPTQASYCSGALFTAFTRTINSIDNGAIFSGMSRAQVQNFIPREVSVPSGSKNKDDYGVYGMINNDGHGIQDLNNSMGNFKFGENIAVGKKSGEKFKEACAGDMMQWDRISNKSGHSGVFLAEIDGKAYFWSSNRSTEGYGVTCEESSNMVPHIVRLTSPHNLAAIPENKAEKKLKGDRFYPEKVEQLVEKVKQAPVEISAQASESHGASN